MKQFICGLALIFPLFLFGQVGAKAGYNYAKVSRASDINSSSRSGFHAGVFYAPVSQKSVASRSEILFSRQGYNYKTSTTGEVNLDYVQVGQLMAVNLHKRFALLFGAQTAYLVSASVDSTETATGGSSGSPGYNLMDMYNRVDYGYAVGFEINPVSGLIVSARYNVSLAKMYKDMENFQPPSFTTEDAKNNVIQLSVGWRLGKE